jgi:hypothetical protein
MNGLVSENMRGKNNYVLNMVQLQRQKIAASRNRLLKLAD